MTYPIELENVRLFDVLRNSLSGELGVVLGVEGDKIALKLKTGEIARFKHGEHIYRVSEDEAVAFRAVIAEQRRQASLLKPRKRGSLRKPAPKAKAKKAAKKA
ncbi:MAG: hypothetical protein M0D55_03430 [Elusimicrobiota bacterium]|nr:MAG: hypothetical protein M0D55_03430 [Elusimicrobiota bacterium]